MKKVVKGSLVGTAVAGLGMGVGRAVVDNVADALTDDVTSSDDNAKLSTWNQQDEDLKLSIKILNYFVGMDLDAVFTPDTKEITEALKKLTGDVIALKGEWLI